MNDQSLSKYLKDYRSPIVLACLAATFLASLLWHFYPTFYNCCDASGYWIKSNSFDDIKLSGSLFRTFAYPTLIAVSRALPRLFGFGDDAERIALSLVQLCLHFLASASLGYAAYAITQNKVITTCAIYVNTLNIFLLAYTNQILTDGVAISFLTLAIASIVLCFNQSHQRICSVGLSGLIIGMLPMIRPALVTGSIALSTFFIFIYLYKYRFKYITALMIGTYAFSFLIPLFIQLTLVPTALLASGSLGIYQLIQGTYVYKYMTLVTPTPHGLAAINQSMKDLLQVCNASSDPTGCVKGTLLMHPLQSIPHYATKFFAINDQVYLTPYVKNFHAPERQFWRIINSLFSAISIFGALALVRKGLENRGKYLFYGITSGTIITILVLPLFVGAPEERFGLTFHPFLALFTGYFVNIFWLSDRRVRLRIIGQSLILTLLLIIFSLKLEPLLTFRLNG